MSISALAAVGFVWSAGDLPAAPPDPAPKPAAGEKVEEFEYVVNNTE
jgi:hypothetical protein